MLIMFYFLCNVFIYLIYFLCNFLLLYIFNKENQPNKDDDGDHHVDLI